MTFSLEIPRDGDVWFFNKEMGEGHGAYTSGNSMETMLTHGWTRFRRQLGIVSGSTIVLALRKLPDVLRVKVRVIKHLGVRGGGFGVGRVAMHGRHGVGL